MNTAIGSLTLALTLIVAPAATQSTSAAAEGPRLVPPPEYDRPFAANVIVITARDQKHVRELCPKAVFTGAALGCASLTPSWDWPLAIHLSWSGATRSRTATAGRRTTAARCRPRSGR